MTPLYTVDEFNKCKSRDILSLQCEMCNQQFTKSKNEIQWSLKRTTTNTLRFCSQECKYKFHSLSGRVNCSCKQCNKQIVKMKCEMRLNNFCSKSCAATYNNTHKTKGNRRSKLEIWLELELTKKYPNLGIHYNRTDAINAELDIYIPSLKLAFELNGIFHYEPIYGKEKLDKIKSNDNRKFQACLEQGISLCIIDTSKLTYFKINSCIKFLDIICNIIDDLNV